VLLGRICTVGYFLYFVGMPFYTRWERVKPAPERLTFHAHA
jgi:ubiquinol-cytochrome c reductase cytochrome b subunit